MSFLGRGKSKNKTPFLVAHQRDVIIVEFECAHRSAIAALNSYAVEFAISTHRTDHHVHERVHMGEDADED